MRSEVTRNFVLVIDSTRLGQILRSNAVRRTCLDFLLVRLGQPCAPCSASQDSAIGAFKQCLLLTRKYSSAVKADAQQAPVEFGKQGAAYAKFRPDYPEDLYKVVLAPSRPTARSLAVDVATGSGQAAKGLSAYFEKIVALDRDPQQLQHAVQMQNVTHQLGAAEQLGMEDNCADLVAVAQGLHWFNRDKFYPEAHRILKPGGYMAAWGYDLLLLPNKPDAQQLLTHLYNNTLGSYWDTRRKHVEQHYKDIEPPRSLFQVQHQELAVKTKMTLPLLTGYLSTWSAYNSYCQLHPEGPDPLEDFKASFRKAAGLASDEEQFEVTYPLFVMLCFPEGKCTSSNAA